MKKENRATHTVDNPASPLRGQRFKDSESIKQSSPRGSGLRNEGRHRPKVTAGVVETVRAEPDLAAAEAEDRGENEASIGTRIVELVARTVDPEIVVVRQTLGMRQDHDPDGEGTETALVGLHDLACSANRAPAMTQTELGGDHENVVILLLACELLEHGLRLGRLAQTLVHDLAVTVVAELAVPSLLDRVEHLLHCLGVGRSDRLPLRDGEPSFGVLRHLALSELLVGESDTREDLAQNVALLRDRLRASVAGEVAVVRGDFLVLELVGDRQVLEGGEGRFANSSCELVAVLDDALGAGFVEVELVENLLDGVGPEPIDLLDLAGGCGLLNNRHHDVISFRLTIRIARIGDLSRS